MGCGGVSLLTPGWSGLKSLDWGGEKAPVGSEIKEGFCMVTEGRWSGSSCCGRKIAKGKAGRDLPIARGGGAEEGSPADLIKSTSEKDSSVEAGRKEEALTTV